jgi:type IV pilus assembly protein PilF
MNVCIVGVVACTLIVISTGCVSSAKRKNDAVLHLRVGTGYLSQGNYPSALRELLIAEDLDPSNEIVQNNLGLVYFFRGHFQLSEQHLKRSVELKPSFSEGRNNHARVLIELMQFDQAIAELGTVLADLTYEEPAKAWVNLGIAYYRKGDFPKARDEFLKAVQIDRSHCLGQDMYGRSLLELGDLMGAAQALDNAVVICKTLNFDEPHYFSGLTYYKLGKTSFAIARMEEVIQLNPNGKYAKKAESLLKLMK